MGEGKGKWENESSLPAQAQQFRTMKVNFKKKIFSKFKFCIKIDWMGKKIWI